MESDHLADAAGEEELQDTRCPTPAKEVQSHGSSLCRGLRKKYRGKRMMKAARDRTKTMGPGAFGIILGGSNFDLPAEPHMPAARRGGAARCAQLYSSLAGLHVVQTQPVPRWGRHSSGLSGRQKSGSCQHARYRASRWRREYTPVGLPPASAQGPWARALQKGWSCLAVPAWAHPAMSTASSRTGAVVLRAVLTGLPHRPALPSPLFLHPTLLR